MNSTMQHESSPKNAMLQAVHLDNVRTAQIGGLTDGITPDVGEDIGYHSDLSAEIAASGTLKIAIQRLAGNSVAREQLRLPDPVEPRPNRERPLLQPNNNQPTVTELRQQAINARNAEARHLRRVYGQSGNPDLPRYRRAFIPKSERD